jgi:predicted amidohydrolase YtcJ
MTAPDLILINGVIHTADRNAPRFSALAIADGKVLERGTDDEIRALADERTRLIDLGGKAVVPGLIDVHNHHLLAGMSDLFELNLDPTWSFDEVVEAIRVTAATMPDDAWVVGEAFGSTLIDAFSRLDARSIIDEAAGGRPVVLTDDSHHNKFANTAALAAAGIDAATPDPAKGRIVRDEASGEPTGLLYESATLAITQAVSRNVQRGAPERQQASARAIEILHSYGITAFQDAAVSVEIMEAVQALDQRGELTAWVVSSMLSSQFLLADTIYGEELIVRGEEFRSEHHRPDFVKVALDGVPTTHTGAFLTPYLDSPDHAHGHCGTTTMTTDELESWLLLTAGRGLSAKIHCTGDAAVRVALDAIEAVRSAGFADVKYHIAHGQFIDDSDLPRFAALDVYADISPYLWFPGVIPDAISQTRPASEVAHMQPNRTLLDLGVAIAGGSDWPVSVSPNPWEGIQGLVTRADPLGRAPGVLWPEQAITLEEALEAFTISSARAMGIDDVAGSLVPGKSADFVILDQDPFAVAPDAIVATNALETWFEGACVYRRS